MGTAPFVHMGSAKVFNEIADTLHVNKHTRENGSCMLVEKVTNPTASAGLHESDTWSLNLCAVLVFHILCKSFPYLEKDRWPFHILTALQNRNQQA